MRPIPEKPGPGQESVWDYPRPPKFEPVPETIRIILGGQEILNTQGAYRVLETSHPPVYYLPATDFAPGVLLPRERTSFCEFKGQARYYSLEAGGKRAEDCAWAYPNPVKAFGPLAGYLAVYAQAMDACFVGDEAVTPQPGGFYGGWITSKVVGPFKGVPGSWGW